MDVDFLKTCALLHDIGKPLCWANGKPWSDHIYYTYDVISSTLGEKYAVIAMRHHTGASYPEKYRPESEEEWKIWLADKLSSGADRRELREGGGLWPAHSFSLTHPLSIGDRNVATLSSNDLQAEAQNILEALRKAGEGSTRDRYLSIFKTLSSSALQRIPADTRPIINDVSLWHHSKLSAAFIVCIERGGGWRGQDPSKYDFSLISGDGDKISSYIQESKRIPDLNARSDKVKKATLEAAGKVELLLGPECLLFAGGGSLLALAPVSAAEEVAAEAAEAFERTMDGEVSFTVSIVKDSGDRIQSLFGDTWKEAGRSLRVRKLQKPLRFDEPLEPDEMVCDVCHRRKARHRDEERILSINAAPRPEFLCDRCWSLREAGRGVWIEDFGKHIAVLKADGDDMGLVLDGTRFKELNKEVTPSRLSTISSYINDVCEEKLRKTIESSGGVCVYAGGDDILAVLPGDKALKAAFQLSSVFREEMAGKCSMSAGIAIFHNRFPIYAGLELAQELLKSAKRRSGKGGIAYAVVGGVGSTVNESKPLSWAELDRIHGIIEFFKNSRISGSQIRRIASTSKDKPEEAELWIKYLVGRKIIPWDKGEELMSYLKSGLLADAFVLYNLFIVR